MFEVEKTDIAGLTVLHPIVRRDERGFFVKTLHAGFFADHGLECGFTEQYYSLSKPGVLRGMHFQTPPHDHAKLVGCLTGHVLDVIVDVRAGSPTYGRHVKVPLSAERGTLVHLVKGLAHGFCVPDVESILLYNVTTVYAPDSDTGIRWDSAGIDWPVARPLVSPRDAGLPRLEDFVSPFRW